MLFLLSANAVADQAFWSHLENAQSHHRSIRVAVEVEAGLPVRPEVTSGLFWLNGQPEKINVDSHVIGDHPATFLPTMRDSSLAVVLRWTSLRCLERLLDDPRIQELKRQDQVRWGALLVDAILRRVHERLMYFHTRHTAWSDFRARHSYPHRVAQKALSFAAHHQIVIATDEQMIQETINYLGFDCQGLMVLESARGVPLQSYFVPRLSHSTR